MFNRRPALPLVSVFPVDPADSDDSEDSDDSDDSEDSEDKNLLSLVGREVSPFSRAPGLRLLVVATMVLMPFSSSFHILLIGTLMISVILLTNTLSFHIERGALSDFIRVHPRVHSIDSIHGGSKNVCFDSLSSWSRSRSQR